MRSSLRFLTLSRNGAILLRSRAHFILGIFRSPMASVFARVSYSYTIALTFSTSSSRLWPMSLKVERLVGGNSEAASSRLCLRAPSSFRYRRTVINYQVLVLVIATKLSASTLWALVLPRCEGRRTRLKPHQVRLSIACLWQRPEHLARARSHWL